MLGANLLAAGIDPKAIDLIAISHFHPDHINGLKDKDNETVFPNAEIMVSAAEWKFWMDDANLSAAPNDLKLTFRNQRRIFSDIATAVTRFEPDQEIAPGITALAAPGHTPGHTVFTIHSGDKSLLVLGDTAQHPAVFARHPNWQATFDIGRHAQESVRSRGRGPHVGDRLSLSLPRLRPSDQDRNRLRACADRVAAEPMKNRCPRVIPAPRLFCRGLLSLITSGASR